MYYGHLCNKSFVPLIKKFRKKGRGYVALVINENTNYRKEVTFTELLKMLNNLGYGYRVSKEIAEYVNTYDIGNIALLFRIKMDIRYNNCIVE